MGMVSEKKSTISYVKWDRGANREFSEEVAVLRMDNGKITYAMGITLPDAASGSSVHAERQQP